MPSENDPSKIENDYPIVKYFNDLLRDRHCRIDLEIKKETAQLFKTAFESTSDIEALKQQFIASLTLEKEQPIYRFLYIIASHLRDRHCVHKDEQSDLNEQSRLEIKADLAMLDFIQYTIEQKLVDRDIVDLLMDRLNFSWDNFTVFTNPSLTKDYQKKVASILANRIHPKEVRWSGHADARHPFEELFFLSTDAHSQSFPALCTLIRGYEELNLGKVQRWRGWNTTYNYKDLLKHYKDSLSVGIYKNISKEGQLNYGYHDYQVEDWKDILELYSPAMQLKIIKKVISTRKENESHQLNLSLGYLEICVNSLNEISADHPFKEESAAFSECLSQIIQRYKSPDEKKRTLEDFAYDLKLACENSDLRLKDDPIISRTLKLIVGLLICLTGIGAIVMVSSATCRNTFFKSKEKSVEHLENLQEVSKNIDKK